MLNPQTGKFYKCLKDFELFKTHNGLQVVKILELHEILFVLTVETYENTFIDENEEWNLKVLTADGFVGYITFTKDSKRPYLEYTNR